MTYNIQDGGKGRESLIFDVFTTVQPDIVFLQEVIDLAVVQQWADALKMTHIVAKGKTLRHAAILSRYPILSWNSDTSFPPLSRDFLSATIEYQPHQQINLFCVHLTAQPFLLYEWLRVREIKAVLRRVTQSTSIPCLIAGDFNAVSPMDMPIKEFLPLRLKAMLFLQGNRFLHSVISAMHGKQFHDCFRTLHTDAGFTLPPPKPTIRFDYIFANATLIPHLQNCYVLHQHSAVEHASDHYPVVAEFAL